MDELTTFADLRPDADVLNGEERDLLWSRISADVEAVAPAEPTTDTARVVPISTITRGSAPPRRRATLVAAAAVAVLGVAGAAVLSGRHHVAKVTPGGEVSVPAPTDVSMPTGPLLTTPVPAMAAPMLVATAPGFRLAYMYADDDLQLEGGGFDSSTVWWGDGPTYDAPLLVASVVHDPALSPSTDATLSTLPIMQGVMADGQPIQVAGTTGAAYATEGDGETGLDGPITTVFWPLGGDLVARVNALRLSLDQVIGYADQLTLDGERLTMTAPAGFREVSYSPPSKIRHLDYRFDEGSRSIEIVGENRGVASLLGRLAGEVRTTRTIAGAEVADRPLPASPGQFWVDWQAGDWTFYAMADGFASRDEFDAVLASVNLTDAATLAAAGSELGILLPGDYAELADRVLTGVSLSAAAVRDAATVALATTQDSFGFELFTGAVCAWRRQWTQTTDESQRAALIDVVQTAITRNVGTPFERASSTVAQPFVDSLKVGTNPVYEVGSCPSWSVAG